MDDSDLKEVIVENNEDEEVPNKNNNNNNKNEEKSSKKKSLHRSFSIAWPTFPRYRSILSKDWRKQFCKRASNTLYTIFL